MKSFNSSLITRFMMSVCALTGIARSEIAIKAEVLSSNATSSTVRFTFSGDLADLSPQVNLRSFLFIDFSASPGLSASLPGVANLTNFASNSVATQTSTSVTTVEVRNNEAGYYDRIGFVFNSALNPETVMAGNSVLEIEFPTTAPITTSDFSSLPIYWCFPNWGTNVGRGTLVGTTNSLVESADLNFVRDDFGQLLIEFTGVLESAPDLETPFTPVLGATSPYLAPVGASSRYFFRASAN